MSQLLKHQQQRAYAVLNAKHTPTKHVWIRSKYHTTYTRDDVIHAMQAYTAVTKTRKQSKKSIRRIAYDHGIPSSTLHKHVDTYIHQFSMLAHPVNNNTDTSISNNNNNNTHDNNTPTLQSLHRDYDSMQNTSYNIPNMGHPTCLSKEQELVLVQYIEEMNKINLCLSKQDIIRTASEYSSQLNIKLSTTTGLLSHKWWQGKHMHTHTHVHMVAHHTY